MIWKEREVSGNKEELEVLLRRLPKRHALYGQVERDNYAETAGQAGEKRFDHYYAASRVTFPHYMLHNVTLKSFRVFQMDSVMITPWGVYVFEVKNMNGRLLFNSHPVQMLQMKEDGTVIGRRSPIEQMADNEWLLEEWLRERDILVPVRSVLVLSYSKQIAENVPPSQPIIFSHQLPRYLHTLPVEQAIFNPDEMKGLAELMVAALVRFVPKPICSDPRYPIEVMRCGVWCAACNRIGMVRRYGVWFCPDCGVSEKNAHIRTIRDWLLLTGEPMTNKVGREILGVGDRHLVSRLLKEMNLNKIGTFKDAKYQL
ncbi:nuclease-related domain-containing protein [Planococcus salinarum]|uniref:nuclease-related domain-containing protein n=1 Tax=Planococcus salinarum TaxID=622695 RepID=UPI00163DC33D|nr:nuclease-related domain-containing protein [Planococcus salinarum]